MPSLALLKHTALVKTAEKANRGQDPFFGFSTDFLLFKKEDLGPYPAVRRFDVFAVNPVVAAD